MSAHVIPQGKILSVPVVTGVCCRSMHTFWGNLEKHEVILICYRLRNTHSDWNS